MSQRCILLKQLYVGFITTNLQALANVPLPCHIEVEAFVKGADSDISVGSQKFEFKPDYKVKLNILKGDSSSMAKISNKLPPASFVTINATISSFDDSFYGVFQSR
jgi:hypothetical protein